MLSPLQLEGVRLELTQLIGKKELTFGTNIILKNYIGVKTINQEVDGITFFRVCGQPKDTPDFCLNDVEEILGHKPQLSDFHRYANDKHLAWIHTPAGFRIINNKQTDDIVIKYDSSKELLDQEPETLKQIVELVKSNQ